MRWSSLLVLFVADISSCLCLCTPTSPSLHIRTIYLQLGDNLGKFVQTRLLEHLSRVVNVHSVRSFDELSSPPLCASSNDILLISLGNTNSFDFYAPQCDFLSLPSESYVFIEHLHSSGYPILLANGKPMDSYLNSNSSNKNPDLHYGALVGAYSLLEHLGYAFLHPLSPHYPSKIFINSSHHYPSPSSSLLPPKIHKDSPYWPDRNFHIHTQHPLELNEVLQGMDIPMNGPLYQDCSQYHSTADPGQQQHQHQHSGGHYCERWEDMVADVVKLFEWCVANKLNKIEWMLLGNYKWGLFDTSDFRKKRLQVLTSLGHQFGLLVGADVTLGNVQQHAWYMVNPRLPFRKQVKQIHRRVDWIFDAGFDFLSTESGMTEFTHPDCKP
jgi:hypothetical protein